MWNSRGFDFSELQNYLPKVVKVEYFFRLTENYKILSKRENKDAENLVDHGCLKTQEPTELDEELWICSSYPFRHKTTLHCAGRKAKKFGDWTMQHLKL